MKWAGILIGLNSSCIRFPLETLSEHDTNNYQQLNVVGKQCCSVRDQKTKYNSYSNSVLMQS